MGRPAGACRCLSARASLDRDAARRCRARADPLIAAADSRSAAARLPVGDRDQTQPRDAGTLHRSGRGRDRQKIIPFRLALIKALISATTKGDDLMDPRRIRRTAKHSIAAAASRYSQHLRALRQCRQTERGQVDRQSQRSRHATMAPRAPVPRPYSEPCTRQQATPAKLRVRNKDFG